MRIYFTGGQHKGEKHTPTYNEKNGNTIGPVFLLKRNFVNRNFMENETAERPPFHGWSRRTGPIILMPSNALKAKKSIKTRVLKMGTRGWNR